MKLTVYHDGRYWVGVVEDQVRGKLKAARHIFGTEPHDEEILQFIRTEMGKLICGLSQEVDAKPCGTKKISPKRLARKAALETGRQGVSTFAQEAIKLEMEKRKRERRDRSKEQREEDKARRWELKLRKAKDKHRGH